MRQGGAGCVTGGRDALRRSRMSGGLIIFLLQAVGISLSGVIAPGPVTAATLAAGARRRHAGALIAAGHGIVEFPLMLLVMAGADRLLGSPPVRIAIGLLGGGFLLLMGAQVLLAARRGQTARRHEGSRHPLWTGMLLTAGNPYFLLWWATIGLALAAQAVQLGALAFAIFAVVHWLCDLAWLELLSLAAHRGSALFGARGERVVAVVCGAALTFFGLRFIWEAGWTWLG